MPHIKFSIPPFSLKVYAFVAAVGLQKGRLPTDATALR